MIMKTNKTYLSYFSATHTSRKVGRAVASGCCSSSDFEELNGTFNAVQPIKLQTQDLLIVAVPVYGGHVAPIALERLRALQGNQTPAVAIVVYGNRDFETAAVQLQDFLQERGFKIVGAAAFVGEHSYSTTAHPIAPHRPNSKDLLDAQKFGESIRQKLDDMAVPTTVNAEDLICPDSGEENLQGFRTFIQQCQAQAKAQPKAPVKLIPTVDTTVCTACGACVHVCPTQAIDDKHPEITDADKCIKCCACVKACPQQARSLATPFGPVLSKFFQLEKNNVSIL